MVKLPFELKERQIEDMEPGEYGYTVPWAMYVTNDMTCYLHAKYTIHPDTGGTIQMGVKRERDGTFTVDITHPYAREHGWTPSSGSGYVGGCEGIPVGQLLS